MIHTPQNRAKKRNEQMTKKKEKEELTVIIDERARNSTIVDIVDAAAFLENRRRISDWNVIIAAVER